MRSLYILPLLVRFLHHHRLLPLIYMATNLYVQANVISKLVLIVRLPPHFIILALFNFVHFQDEIIHPPVY